ncbi:MAG: NAD+ synthase [Candidatus Heimdallarchaeota archaeon]|nr:NAD+ synthase [Candidatus Heimdallarchaeota archaeon]
MKTIPPIDVEQITKLIEEFIRIRVKESGLNGVVIGVSGGIDSAVVTTLAVRALGPERVFALFLPSGTTPSEDLADVTNLCKILGINLKVIDIQNIIHSVSTEIKEKEDSNRLEWMNLKPRIRQTIWYFYANKMNCLICGGGNKSELMIGYYTKYGDGAVDLLPIGDIYKTHVYQLAKYLKIPKKILMKAPSAGLSENQTDETEIGMSYDLLDAILFGLEHFQTESDIANLLEISIERVKEVKSMLYSSEHKRRGPILLKLGVRTPNIDWRIPLVEPSEF